MFGLEIDLASRMESSSFLTQFTSPGELTHDATVNSPILIITLSLVTVSSFHVHMLVLFSLEHYMFFIMQNKIYSLHALKKAMIFLVL